MKIFLNISNRSEQKAIDSTYKVFNYLKSLEYVLTYNCFENSTLKDIKSVSEIQSEDLYKAALKSLQQSDIVILEVSTNSFTQGYILQKSLEMGKPVIALHQRGKYSIFIKGIKNTLLQTIEYDDYSLNESLEEALQFAIENLMTKFNFYLSSDISNYLNWISKKKNLPKSEFVRALIRDHMSRNTGYLSSLT